MVSLECLGDTDESFEDEIYVSGSYVDAYGRTFRAETWKLGDFETDDYLAPNRVLARYALGQQFPQSFVFIPVLCENRDGGFTAFMDRLHEGTAEVVRETLESVGLVYGAWLGGLSGGGIAGAVVGGLVGWLLGRGMASLFEWLTNWWDEEDMVFQPIRPLTIEINSAAQIRRRYAVDFYGDEGHYKATFQWRVV
jgi:hypothetical protein